MEISNVGMPKVNKGGTETNLKHGYTNKYIHLIKWNEGCIHLSFKS